MQAMPKPTVLAAAGAIAFCAVAGVYLGVARSLIAASGAGEEAGLAAAPVTPVASAKPILTPALDEAEVRRLARQEAQALLAHGPSRKDNVADDEEDAASGDEPKLTPAPPPPPPAANKPSAPAAPNSAIPF